MSGAPHHRRTADAPVLLGELKEETALPDADAEKPPQRQYKSYFDRSYNWKEDENLWWITFLLCGSQLDGHSANDDHDTDAATTHRLRTVAPTQPVPRAVRFAPFRIPYLDVDKCPRI